MKSLNFSVLTRRRFLTSAAVIVSTGVASQAVARTFVGGVLPWAPNAGDPPIPVRPGPWLFFTYDEASAVEAMVDRLIPADDLGPGGKEAGCAVFIDRQLTGSFGNASRLFMKPPFMPGTPTQGNQSPLVPKQSYRTALAELDKHCKTNFEGKGFAALSASQQDSVLQALERGQIKFTEVDAQTFFNLLLQNTMEGFFGDPLYGGNRDMTSWKLIGFPGARYDYRDHIDKHNQPYPHPPVSILGRPDWNVAE
jgi:gluconate 2-dehydrogenase gamma chain